jgi:hypothetical protein
LQIAPEPIHEPVLLDRSGFGCGEGLGLIDISVQTIELNKQERILNDALRDLVAGALARRDIAGAIQLLEQERDCSFTDEARSRRKEKEQLRR